MKILKIIFRLLGKYKLHTVINIITNFLSVLFSLFSISMGIPFLGILFGTQEVVSTKPELTFTIDSLTEYFNYIIHVVSVEHSKATGLLVVSLFILFMVFFKTLFRYISVFFLAPILNGVIRDIRQSIFIKILELPLSYFSGQKKGDIISKMTNDVREIEWSVLTSLEVLFKAPFFIIIYLSFLIYLSPKLSLFIIIFLPVSGFIVGRIGKTLERKSFKSQLKMGFLVSIIEETLSGLRIIKAHNAEKYTSEKFYKANNAYTKLMIKVFGRRFLASPLSEFMSTIILVVVVWYGANLALDKQNNFSYQELIGYLFIFSQVFSPVKSLSTAYYDLNKGMASFQRINTILNADISIKEINSPHVINSFEKQIEFKNVNFKYEDKLVLNNINLIIKKGQTIALVGKSGSGKTTIADLIPRLYDVTNGEILIDNINIKDLKISSLRNLIGLVNQNPILFNDSFFNNISFGANNITENEVVNAAKIANSHEFIKETKLSYYSNIGERGEKISGGQRQRISIARAILKNPPILILDEATSSLDSESEKIVHKTIADLMKNRTSIIIAHRLSTIKNADNIFVIDEGRVVESGTHDNLIAKNGYYKKLHDLQMFD